MDAEPGEWELLADAVDGRDDPGLAPTHERNTFGPAGAQVDHRQGVEEGTGGELTAAGDGRGP
jgi:hypothetical protein